MGGRKSKKQKDRVPQEIVEHFLREISNFDVDGLAIGQRGKYFYAYVGGSPLCRFSYQGDKEIWGFAIYKYSTASYSDNEFCLPIRGKIRDCLTTALKYYDYL